MSGTDIGHAPTFLSLPYAMYSTDLRLCPYPRRCALGGVRSQGRNARRGRPYCPTNPLRDILGHFAIVLRTRYAMSGTDICHWHRLSSYEVARPCPELRKGMALPGESRGEEGTRTMMHLRRRRRSKEGQEEQAQGKKGLDLRCGLRYLRVSWQLEREGGDLQESGVDFVRQCVGVWLECQTVCGCGCDVDLSGCDVDLKERGIDFQQRAYILKERGVDLHETVRYFMVDLSASGIDLTRGRKP
eukprot:3739947-Rhodomonas_salina.1